VIASRSLGCADAQIVLQAMAEACEKRNLDAVLAVADNHGEPIALLRLDRARLASVQIALNKAYTAARECKSTREVGAAARSPSSGFEMAYFGDHRFTGWGGGLPVVLQEECIGAVSVSGLTEELDEEIAGIGVAAFLAAHAAAKQVPACCES
jgi:glc operon protein GlcG